MSTVTPAAPTLPAADMLGLDADLNDEERMLRDTVRQFVQREMLPEVSGWFESGELPSRELALRFGELGLLGMHLDGYGCAGASPTAYGLVCAELEAGDTGLRSLVSVQGSLAMFPIHRFGSEEQKQEWLPRMARGEALGCFGLTEPDAGSDPGSMRTTARRAGGDWILNGTKMWITTGSIADIAVVWAKTDDRIRGFLVPRGTPGFTTQDIHHKLSLRASVTSELILDDVRLPASAELPGARGLGGPLTVLGEARLGIVFGATGAARACLEAAVDYARTRIQFGKPIGSFQLTQAKLAAMGSQVAAAQLLALRLGRMKEAGRLTPEHVSLGKYANVSSALAVAREARTIMGANGITLEYPVMRHAANLETVLTYEGTHEVHSLVLGRALTGLSAFG